MFAGERLFASVALAVMTFVGLGILFGFGRRTLLAVVVLVVGVNVLYPGGARGLMIDALRPLRALTDATADRRDGRRERIDAAVGETP